MRSPGAQGDSRSARNYDRSIVFVSRTSFIDIARVELLYFAFVDALMFMMFALSVIYGEFKVLYYCNASETDSRIRCVPYYLMAERPTNFGMFIKRVVNFSNHNAQVIPYAMNIRIQHYFPKKITSMEHKCPQIISPDDSPRGVQRVSSPE